MAGQWSDDKILADSASSQNHPLIVLKVYFLIPTTHAPETGTITRLHFLAPAFGADFPYHIMRLE